jgi:hypothetical protein
MVPAERIELPTFGLQNRCTTAVLRRPCALRYQAAAARARPMAAASGRRKERNGRAVRLGYDGSLEGNPSLPRDPGSLG